MPYILIHKNDNDISSTPTASVRYAHPPSRKFDTANTTNPHLLYLLFDATVIAPITDSSDPPYSKNSSNFPN